MLFNSFSFALFLPITFALYWILPHKFRWVFLLLSSYFFYMCWNPAYIFLIILTTVITYLSARFIERSSSTKKRKWILAGAVISCLGILFVFKYFNFFFASLEQILHFFSIPFSTVVADLILPVGISFYTFQTMSYVIDVYRGKIGAERHFGYYATFISFFPQLVAGPIERADHLLPQIKAEHVFDYQLATYGLKQMAWGYFKKMVIADTLAVYTGSVFTNPTDYHGMSLVLAILAFTLQIYCDFSGYSDIAIGTAKLFGIRLVDNFRAPYFSASFQEFWRRWHISLSEWMRDYVYIPLGGNRKGRARQNVNLISTFLVSGLWHGANWTFVVWGGLHGLAQVVERYLPKRKKNVKVGRILNIIVVFLFVALAWTFFASESLSDAVYIISHLFEGIGNPAAYLHNGMQTNLPWESIRCLVISIFLLGIFDYASLKCDVIEKISSMKKGVRWSIYTAFLVWLLMNIQIADNSQFIYFQF